MFTAQDTAGPAELAGSALTVWLRINRKAPYIDLRWASELYVPTGTSDADRVAAADGMWAELPRRNGRHDIHANRLGQALYGRHVRCVSFLSTSVRATATANLLAQPLNELSPARIFDAIAALTGSNGRWSRSGPRAPPSTPGVRRNSGPAPTWTGGRPRPRSPRPASPSGPGPAPRSSARPRCGRAGVPGWSWPGGMGWTTSPPR